MKPMKLFMATAMLAIGSTAAMAQASYTDKDGNEYQFKRHWFLDVQAGGQYTVGEASFSDLLSPNFQALSATSSLLFSTPWSDKRYLEQGRMERIQGYQGRYSVYRQLQMEICSSGCGLYVQPL